MTDNPYMVATELPFWQSRQCCRAICGLISLALLGLAIGFTYWLTTIEPSTPGDGFHTCGTMGQAISIIGMIANIVACLLFATFGLFAYDPRHDTAVYKGGTLVSTYSSSQYGAGVCMLITIAPCVALGLWCWAGTTPRTPVPQTNNGIPNGALPVQRATYAVFDKNCSGISVDTMYNVGQCYTVGSPARYYCWSIYGPIMYSPTCDQNDFSVNATANACDASNYYPVLWTCL